MSYNNSNQDQNQRNQGNYDRNQQQRRNDSNNHPDKNFYVPKQRREEENNNTQVHNGDKAEGNKNAQGNAESRVRLPYKENKQDGYNNNNYDKSKGSYNKGNAEGKDSHGDDTYYSKRTEGQSRGDNYQNNYHSGNQGYRKYQGEGGRVQGQHWDKKDGDNNRNNRGWQNAGEGEGYGQKKGQYDNRRNYEGEEYKKGQREYPEKRSYNKYQNGDSVVNKEDANKQTESKDQGNKTNRPTTTNTTTNTPAVDNKNGQQMNKPAQTPQVGSEQAKSVQTQQKEDTTSQIAAKPITAQTTAPSKPVEAKKENATQPQTSQVQTQPQNSSLTNYIQAPVGNEQNRLLYAPGPVQFIQLPIVYQTPYIVFPQPNGLSVVQPLYQVPSSALDGKNQANAYSIPANLIQSTDKLSSSSPQLFGFPQSLMMNPMMGAAPMMYVMPGAVSIPEGQGKENK